MNLSSSYSFSLLEDWIIFCNSSISRFFYSSLDSFVRFMFRVLRRVLSFSRLEISSRFLLISSCRDYRSCLKDLFSSLRRLLSNSNCAQRFCLMVFLSFSSLFLASLRLLSLIQTMLWYSCSFFEETYSRCRLYAFCLYSCSILVNFDLISRSKSTNLLWRVSFADFQSLYFRCNYAIKRSVSICSEQLLYFSLWIFLQCPGRGVGVRFLSFGESSMRSMMLLRVGVPSFSYAVGLILTQNLLRSRSSIERSDEFLEMDLREDDFSSCLRVSRQVTVEEVCEDESSRNPLTGQGEILW